MTDRDPKLEPKASRSSRIGLFLGPALFATLIALGHNQGDVVAIRMAAIAALMAVWWITEAIPLAATALVPLVLFPLLGIMSGKEVAPIYVNHVIFLFIGGFIIALAMQRWNLHRRIALWIIRVVGSSPSRLVLSFMLASAFLSMWISNTAAAIMMMTIGLAIISHEEQQFGAERTGKLAVGLLLGIAYGCSVGGIATLVGTPPNLSFVRIFEITFPAAEGIGFGQWFLLGLPLALIMLAAAWFLITQVFFRTSATLKLSSDVIRAEIKSLGPMSWAEKCVLAVFLSTAVLWVFRKDLTLGGLTVPGWSRLLAHPELIDDGTVAVSMALLMFLIPSRSQDGSDSRMLLGAQVFREIPWHIVLLFGGGFALAAGFKESGLSTLVGGQFEGLAGQPPLIVIAMVCLTLTFLTELTSNTATTEMVLPILASVAVAMELNPLLLMIPATLSASFAFMMPVATPPNAIIFGSGRIRIAQMVRIGIVLNLVGATIITLYFYFFSSSILGIEMDGLPDWVALDN